MKKYFVLAAVVICGIGLISWGATGHMAVAQIAENHLTPKTQEAVKALLGHHSLADISTWADEIRSEPAYKYTGARHFINLPSGYDFEQFSAEVKSMHEDNVYKAIIRNVRELQNPNLSKYDRVLALKFLVHFVGDMHQPMHISHAEDRGGNSIGVTMGTYGGNLHGLWDSGLLDRENYTYEKIATVYDTATPEQIKKWQSDDPMIWAWESYQISSILYQETAENSNFGENYYDDHIVIIHQQIEKAGIRLAGLLNMVFDRQ